MKFFVVLVCLVALAAGRADPDPSIEFTRIHKFRDEDKCYDNEGKAQVCAGVVFEEEDHGKELEVFE